MITEIILRIRDKLNDSKDSLAYYSFGEDAHGRSIESIINNGFCFCFAVKVKSEFPDCNLVGSPTHVFIEYQGFFYDISNPKGSKEKLTNYPLPLIDYNIESNIINEFYNFNEATFYFNEALHGKYQD